jgi:ATP-dependent RNA helicase HrpB
VTLDLPIVSALPRIQAALAGPGAAVVVAEPGAGKTTVVPLELLSAPWLAGRRIVMLEPRRVAARLAARRMAHTLAEPVGRTVGYRVRFDTRVSAATRLEVVTEGVLTRMLADDPSLESVGLVIFDEFHERSLPADTGLALTLESRQVLRPDLRVLVMSATIDPAPVARLMGGAPVVDCPGRTFPVETRFRPLRDDRRFEAQVAAVVREALAADSGDVLVFLPGAGEIRRVAEALDTEPPVRARVLPLHGSMPAEAQDLALTPGRDRRVVLSTAIAETSLTIEGVSIVVDGGRMRVPRFSPRTGMTRLETVRVTRASADQRRGRAGRLEPGVCYRLWSEGDDAGLVPFNLPEILSADLAPLVLDLAAAGIDDPGALAWLDAPPASAWAQARELLGLLGALDPGGRPTDRGRAMAGLALHPRLARMALDAAAQGASGLGAELVALLGDRDIARRGPEPADVDLRLRVEALRAGSGVHGLEVDRGGLARARREAGEWRRRLVGSGRSTARLGDVELTGRFLAAGFPDRVAQRRPGSPGRFLLRNGRGAALPVSQSLARADYLVIAELDDRGAEARIDLAAPVELADLETECADAIERREVLEWDAERAAVRTSLEVRLGAIVLEERPLARPDPDRVREALLAGLAGLGVDRLPWTDAASGLRRRLAFLHHHDPDRWPDVSDAALAATLAQWLGPRLGGARRLAAIADLDLGAALLDQLDWRRRADLDRLAPERWEVPTGSRLAIDYSDPAAPVLPVKLQEVFGLEETPSIGGGRVPLTLHLLSPAMRPVQVTRDLAGFWRTSYFDVRKDLRGRYPKHDWPEDPLTARPVRGAKRRR